MACTLERNPITGRLERVLAPNGEESTLFQTALEYSGNESKALELWATSKTNGFLNSLPPIPSTRQSADLKGFEEFYTDSSSILFDRKGNTLTLQPKENSFNDLEAFDSLMEEVINYSDLHGLTTTLPKTTDNLIAEMYDFTETSTGYTRTPIYENQVFESNGEATLGKVFEYLDSVSKDNEIQLSETDVTDVRNIMAYLDIDSSNELLAELDKVFRMGILDATELNKSIIFDEYTKERIIIDEVAQENLIELRDKLNNAVESIDNTYESFDDLKVINTTNSYGIPVLENPYTVQSAIQEAVADTRTREQFDNAIQDIEYDSIIERYSQDSKYADRIYNEFKDTKRVTEVELTSEGIQNKTTPNRVTSTIEAMDLDIVDMTNDITVFENLTNEDWTYSKSTIKQGLLEIEKKAANSGIDFRGLSDKIETKSQEEITSFLSSLKDLQINPTQENFNNFLELYNSFFEVQNPTIESYFSIQDNELSNNIVRVSKNASEYSLFQAEGLLKLNEEGIYRRVGKIPFENVVEAIVNEAENGNRTLPDEAYGYKDIKNNKEKVIDNVESYIRQQASELDLGENTFDSNIANQIAALKLYYEIPLNVNPKNNFIDSVGLLNRFNGNYQELKTNFHTKFQIDKLNSFYNNKDLYDKVYSKFEIDKDGIKLKNNNPIEVMELRNEMSENLTVEDITDLTNYAAVSKESSIKNLFNQDLVAEPTKDLQRAYYQNNKYELPRYTGDYTRVSEGVKTELNSENFIRIQSSLFEKMQDIGENSFYKQIEDFNGDFNEFSEDFGGELINNFAINELNSYIADPKETVFNSVENNNLYTKNELENINQEEFNCSL